MKDYLETEGGGITQLSYSDDLSIIHEGTWNVGGKDPCHIALSPGGRFLAIANFTSGSVTICPLDTDGNVVVKERKIFSHTGSSVHPTRQKGPHAHSCILTEEPSLLYVPDLGLDKVVVYEYVEDNLTKNASLGFSVPAGSGPRYGEFSKDGKHFYLINEISSQVLFFNNTDGRLEYQQTVSTLPEGFTGENICSDLHLTPDGTKLFASNRGHDSLVCYQVMEDGCISFINRQPCGGKTPRNFAIDPSGEYLLVGNQDSDYICVFKIESKGYLILISKIQTGSPVCIKFFNPFLGVTTPLVE